MNLENNLYRGIEFTNRRKRGIIQPRYMNAIRWLSGGDNDFLGGSGSTSKGVYSENTWGPTPLKKEKPNMGLVSSYFKEEKKSNPTTIVDFPASGFQLHYHEQEDGSITGGKIKPYQGTKEDEYSLDNYKISTRALYAALLGWKEIKSDE